jgi:hypothetical protein
MLVLDKACQQQFKSLREEIIENKQHGRKGDEWRQV